MLSGFTLKKKIPANTVFILQAQTATVNTPGQCHEGFDLLCQKQQA